MIVLGLTGGIGMGKSTTAALFAEAGVPVWDADGAVHRLYAPGGDAVAPVLAAFPEAGSPKEGIDRNALSAAVVGKPDALATLEKIVHPLVFTDRQAFLDAARADGTKIVLADIPLLYETGLEGLVDRVIVVSAPEAVRRERVLARPGMTPEKYAAIVARQTPDAEKRARADHVIDTGQGIDAARAEVRAFLAQIGENETRDAPANQTP